MFCTVSIVSLCFYIYKWNHAREVRNCRAAVAGRTSKRATGVLQRPCVLSTHVCGRASSSRYTREVCALFCLYCTSTNSEETLPSNVSSLDQVSVPAAPRRVVCFSNSGLFLGQGPYWAYLRHHRKARQLNIRSGTCPCHGGGAPDFLFPLSVLSWVLHI